MPNALARTRAEHESIRLNYGSLYGVVDALERRGLIEAVETSQQGRRPQRTVYAITEAGKTELTEWPCWDVASGFFDRLRSLPVGRPALLAGRALADTALLTWGLVVTTAIGFVVGFRLHGSVGQGATALGLCILLGFAFTWMFITIGLVAGSAQAAQGMSLLIFPLTFVSSAYVPVDSMPGWMQPVAEHQPLTVMVDAVRSLTLGDPAAAGLPGTTGHWVVLSLAWSVALVAAFAPLAVLRYRRG